MPALLSHYRPDYPIYTFTEDLQVQRRLALYHGVTALYIKFQPDAESTFDMCALIHSHTSLMMLGLSLGSPSQSGDMQQQSALHNEVSALDTKKQSAAC